MDLTTCPECGNAAEITSRDVFESTDGPIEHAKVVCVAHHWFVMPVASLAAAHHRDESARSRPERESRSSL